MKKNWKKKLSSFLICTLLATTCIPNMVVNANPEDYDFIIGANGTKYDADYEPDIINEDDWYSDDSDDESDVRILATPSNDNEASPSNASEATPSDADLASGSNAGPLNIVEFTDPGPLLPAVGGMRRMMRAARAGGEQDDGIHMDKTATKTEDGYKIKLEAFVEGNININRETSPVDIVLVLDVSGSMKNCIVCGGSGKHPTSFKKVGTVGDYRGDNWTAYYYKNENGQYKRAYYSRRDGWQKEDESTLSRGTEIYEGENYETCTSRIDALKTAVKGFIDSVAQNAQENNVEHNIAIVKFAGDKKSQIGNDTYNDWYNYNYSQTVKPLTDVRSGANELIDAVQSFSPAGATSADYGMQLAQNIIDGIPSDRSSQKAVVMFTDGEPNHGNNFDSDVATDAISASYNLKQDQVAVYTIGVFDGADARVPMSPDASNVNKYMHYVSSNFEDARSMEYAGSPTYPDEGSYYMSTNNASGLDDIFQNISSLIQSGGAATKLGTSTEINDVMSDYFELPDNASDIQVFEAACTGEKDAQGEYIFNDGVTERRDITSEVDVDMDTANRSVSVTGFNYSHNFVATKGRVEGDASQQGDFYGKKLIIEFTVNPRDGFLGGNNVPTNDPSSGLSSKEPVVDKTFEVPKVNVQIPEFTVRATDKNVYLTGSLTDDQLKEGATVTTDDGQTIDLSDSANNFGLEEWQNAFVNITPEGPSVAIDKLLQDRTYDLNVTIAPKSDADDTTNAGTPASEKTGTAKGNIYVFRPTFKFKDGKTFYGAAVPADRYLDSLRLDEVEWKHGNMVSTFANMIGTAPVDFKFGYEFNSGLSDDGETINTKQDVPVTVNSVCIGTDSTELVEYTTPVREKCNDTEAELGGKATFVLHVETGELTIEKKGGAADEPYVFTILRNGEEYTSASVTGNTSVTIKELPVGIYTIQEDSQEDSQENMGWSWRYSAKYSESIVIKEPETGEDGSIENHNSGTIICTNSKNKHYWLNGYSAVVENIFGTGKEERKVSRSE